MPEYLVASLRPLKEFSQELRGWESETETTITDVDTAVGTFKAQIEEELGEGKLQWLAQDGVLAIPIKEAGGKSESMKEALAKMRKGPAIGDNIRHLEQDYKILGIEGDEIITTGGKVKKERLFISTIISTRELCWGISH